MAKRLIINESQFNQLIINGILTESNFDEILKSHELEKKIKDVTSSAIKNDKGLERELEEKVRKVVAKSVSELFKTLWQKKCFWEKEF